MVYAAIDQNPENFFSGEMGGFSGVSEDQRFYINEDGNAVIVFEKYEIDVYKRQAEGSLRK